jgi:hypothetical protein
MRAMNEETFGAATSLVSHVRVNRDSPADSLRGLESFSVSKTWMGDNRLTSATISFRGGASSPELEGAAPWLKVHGAVFRWLPLARQLPDSQLFSCLVAALE